MSSTEQTLRESIRGHLKTIQLNNTKLPRYVGSDILVLSVKFHNNPGSRSLLNRGTRREAHSGLVPESALSSSSFTAKFQIAMLPTSVQSSQLSFIQIVYDNHEISFCKCHTGISVIYSTPEL
jgi:hypothetical protein